MSSRQRRRIFAFCSYLPYRIFALVLRLHVEDFQLANAVFILNLKTMLSVVGGDGDSRAHLATIGVDAAAVVRPFDAGRRRAARRADEFATVAALNVAMP